MDVSLQHSILAAVTIDQTKVGGGIPVFYATNQKELEQLATYISKITLGAVHDLGNGTYIIVRH